MACYSSASNFNLVGSRCLTLSSTGRHFIDSGRPFGEASPFSAGRLFIDSGRALGLPSLSGLLAIWWFYHFSIFKLSRPQLRNSCAFSEPGGVLSSLSSSFALSSFFCVVYDVYCLNVAFFSSCEEDVCCLQICAAFE